MTARRKFLGTAAASTVGAAALIASGSRPRRAADITLNAQSGFPETSLRGRLGSVDVHLSHNTVLANEMNAVKLVSVLQ